ncbi:MAG: phosphatidylglycerol lysyltransferase domain-containing protein [Treponema sp.]|jgi:hypothetical protein|nr:phosphatidylglycerol lysyltransferase domain-containing protein [Treponema sp.]
MQIPCYPEFTPLDFQMKDEMLQELFDSPDGISEFSFAGLYLFRRRYRYQVSRLAPEGLLLISGLQPGDSHGGSKIRGGERFFLSPCGAPGQEILRELFKDHRYWKNIGESVLPREVLEAEGLAVAEDRDNSDYLYLRTDLAELPGKKYHKKRNLVNQFLDSYDYQEWPLTEDLVPQALEVLDRWKEEKGEEGDYVAAREALEQFRGLGMEGALYFIDGKPAGWCLGEGIAGGTIFTVHFEKAAGGYKGIYQFMNQAFARMLPPRYLYINREQDLGDEGLRQAKMTYRPCRFVRKFAAAPRGEWDEGPTQL